mgnify:CR=1 FL=1
MEFAPAAASDPESWSKGSYGILEPLSDIPAWPPSSINVICVPGKYFGTRGERQGRGAGFYDRYLPEATKAVRVGIAWDSQIQENLMQKPWDQSMDWVVTEKRIIRGERGSPRK